MTFTDNVKARDPVGSKKDYIKYPHRWTKNDQNWPKANITAVAVTEKPIYTEYIILAKKMKWYISTFGCGSASCQWAI